LGKKQTKEEEGNPSQGTSPSRAFPHPAACLLRSQARANALPHAGHRCGFSSVCDRSWLSRCEARANRFAQCAHACGLNCAWINSWRDLSKERANRLPQVRGALEGLRAVRAREGARAGRRRAEQGGCGRSLVVSCSQNATLPIIIQQKIETPVFYFIELVIKNAPSLSGQAKADRMLSLFFHFFLCSPL